MISGALFLNPQKKVDIKKLYARNILRIITAFLFWSAVYTFVAWYANLGINSKLDLLTTFMKGHYHMWFLLMIAGLYIIVPAVRLITQNEKVMKYFLIISFVFTVAIPTVETLTGALLTVYPERHWSAINDAFNYDVSMMNFTFATGHVLYFVLGYYLSQYDLTKRIRKIIYLLSAAGFALTIFLTAFISVKTGKSVETFHGYFELNVFMEAVGVFVFFKYARIYPKAKIAEKIQKISGWSFGVYLIHALILETAHHFHFDALSFSPVISVPVIAALIFVISTVGSVIIHKIPVLNKYIV